MHPILKWPGGKRWLAPCIESVYNACGRPYYVEPFAGGMSVALRIRPTNATINDLNPHLINFYQQLQEGVYIPSVMPMANSLDYYYSTRRSFNEHVEINHITGPLMAAYFYYLCKTCFNGLCRFNKTGHFNTPYGRYDKINYALDKDVIEVIKEWDFYVGDFTDVEVESGDFIYLDPPYKGKFAGYTSAGFNPADHDRLLAWISKHDGPIVLSNSMDEGLVTAYHRAGFKVGEVYGPRSIAADGEARGLASEILAFRGVEPYLGFREIHI